MENTLLHILNPAIQLIEIVFEIVHGCMGDEWLYYAV